jgi:hypothetical protein
MEDGQMNYLLARLSAEIKAEATELKKKPNQDATRFSETAHLSAILVLESLAKAIERSMK